MSNFKAVSFKKLISVCGLDCTKCKIYLAQYNPGLANKLVTTFTNFWDNVKPEDFHCSSCKGELSNCWTKECWIRDCCINDKALEFCYQCVDFPCIGLEKWANQNKRYKSGLNNLRKMKKKRK